MRTEACRKFRLIRRIYSGDGYRDYYVFKLDGFPVVGKVYKHDVRFFKVWDLDVCMDYYLLRIRRVKRKFDSSFSPLCITYTKESLGKYGLRSINT